MENLRNYADDRNTGFCVYCGGPPETRDHVPSKVLLDEPLPPHIPNVPACAVCNAGFSLDEEYFACLIEACLRGSADDEALECEKVRRILSRKESLRKALRAAMLVSDSQVVTRPDPARVSRVVLKLARGHAAFELNQPQLAQPDALATFPLHTLPPDARGAFERGFESAAWPEVGSRAMQRAIVADADVRLGGWVEVQRDRYRFAVTDDAAVCVRIVLSEYLAAEVIWQ